MLCERLSFVDVVFDSLLLSASEVLLVIVFWGINPDMKLPTVAPATIFSAALLIAPAASAHPSKTASAAGNTDAAMPKPVPVKAAFPNFEKSFFEHHPVR